MWSSQVVHVACKIYPAGMKILPGWHATRCSYGYAKYLHFEPWSLTFLKLRFLWTGVARKDPGHRNLGYLLLPPFQNESYILENPWA